MANKEGLLILRDEEGQEIEFEYLDTVSLNTKEFIVLLPVDDIAEDGSVELVILQVEQFGEEERFLPVEDPEELQAVFEMFKEAYNDRLGSFEE